MEDGGIVGICVEDLLWLASGDFALPPGIEGGCGAKVIIGKLIHDTDAWRNMVCRGLTNAGVQYPGS